MPSEQTPRFEDALKRQPSWDPPPGFSHRVVMLASAAGHPRPVHAHLERDGGLLQAAGVGLIAAAGAYVVGSLVSVLMVSIAQATVTTIGGYTTVMEVMARGLASRAVLVSWTCAVLSLSCAASLVLRART